MAHAHRSIIAGLLLGLACGVQADSSSEEDLARVYGSEEFVSIATGSRQPLARAPAVATVITAEDIAAMGATNLDEVLESVPGLHVSLSSTRFTPIYSIRGIYSDQNPQVLMLVNGVPMTQLLFGDRGARSSLPVTNIARIEVIRGPGSAVYGADAFAGVINVTTKSAADIDGTVVGARAGSFDYRNGWLQHGGEWAGFDLAFSLDWSTTDSDKGRIIESDAQSLFDAAFGTDVSLAPGPADMRQDRVDLHLNAGRDNWRLHFWNWRQSDMGVGPGLALALDHSGESEVDNYLFDVAYLNDDLFEDWELKAQASFMDVNTDSRQTLFPPGTVLPIGADGNVNPVAPTAFVLFPDGLLGQPSADEWHRRLDLAATYGGFDQHRVRVAAGVHDAQLKPTEKKNFGPGVTVGTLTDVTATPFVFIPKENRFVYYGSLQDEWAIAPDWDLTAGVRYDHYSDFGATVNPRAAVVWQTRHDLTTKLLYGRAFRAPAFGELFFINNPVGLGNPDLKPEEINTVELGFDYQPLFNLRTALNIFRYKIDNQIEFVADPAGQSFTAQNRGGQTGTGMELEARWDVTPTWRVSGNYSFQRSEDDQTGSDAGNAPRHQAYLDLRWQFRPQWSINTQLNAIGERRRIVGDVRSNLRGYTNVDLTLRRSQTGDPWAFAFSVRNLFDSAQKEPSPADPAVPAGSVIPGDFPLSGRSLYAEMSYRF